MYFHITTRVPSPFFDRTSIRSINASIKENGRQNIQRAQQGDRKIRQQMITENMGLVYMVAKRFANRGTDLQDLTQIGVIGLIKAIDRFDTSLSYSFSTYAVPLIMGEIRRFLRDDGILLLTFPFYVFPHNHTCSFSFF